MYAVQRIYVYDDDKECVAKYSKYPEYVADCRAWVDDDDTIVAAQWIDGYWDITEERLIIDGDTYHARIMTEIV